MARQTQRNKIRAKMALGFVEPDVDAITSESSLAKALTAYTREIDVKVGREWLIEYANDNVAGTVNALKRAANSEFSVTYCALARLVSRGYDIPADKRKRLHAKIKTIAENNRPEPKMVVVIKKKSPAELVKIAAGDLIAEIDGEIDDFENSDLKMYELLSERKVARNGAHHIVAHYTRLIDELKMIDSDSEIKDSYRVFGIAKAKRLLKFVQAIVSDCDMYITGKKATRKPRKRKVKNAQTIVRNVKFKKEDTDLKVVSIDPINIVGSSILIVYNTVQKTMTRYVAADGETLSIKGTTITGFDGDKSKMKRIRRADRVIHDIVGAGKRAAANAWKSIKSSENDARGRLNDSTVLLAAIK